MPKPTASALVSGFFFFAVHFFAFFSVNVVIKRSITHNARNVYYTDSAKTKIPYGLKISCTVDSLIYPSCLHLLSQIFHRSSRLSHAQSTAQNYFDSYLQFFKNFGQYW